MKYVKIAYLDYFQIPRVDQRLQYLDMSLPRWQSSNIQNMKGACPAAWTTRSSSFDPVMQREQQGARFLILSLAFDSKFTVIRSERFCNHSTWIVFGKCFISTTREQFSTANQQKNGIITNQFIGINST